VILPSAAVASPGNLCRNDSANGLARSKKNIFMTTPLRYLHVGFSAARRLTKLDIVIP
jgi:hypothetical protein